MDFLTYDIQVDQYSVEDCRLDLDKIVDFYRSKDYHHDAVNAAFCVERQLPMWLADEQKVFFVNETETMYDTPDWMKTPALGFADRGFLYQFGRLVYPLFDVKGHTMGFCGWDPFVEPKYLDSRNYGYRAKHTTLYGMEKLPEYYKSGKPIFVVEGIVCCLYLRSLGYQALALLGSSITSYVLVILRRFGDRLILVPDCDEAGEHLVKTARYNLPLATVIQVSKGKDIDGCRKIDNHQYEEELKRVLALAIQSPKLLFLPNNIIYARR